MEDRVYLRFRPLFSSGGDHVVAGPDEIYDATDLLQTIGESRARRLRSGTDDALLLAPANLVLYHWSAYGDGAPYAVYGVEEAVAELFGATVTVADAGGHADAER